MFKLAALARARSELALGVPAPHHRPVGPHLRLGHRRRAPEVAPVRAPAALRQTDRRRRAIGLRFAGERATYAVRNTRLSIHPNIDVGIEHGAHFPNDPGHHIFPQVWSR